HPLNNILPTDANKERLLYYSGKKYPMKKFEELISTRILYNKKNGSVEAYIFLSCYSAIIVIFLNYFRGLNDHE
ncbi:MAG: hypothetical protein WCE54_04990, partial [Ignavibacteriaceae bacterium]